MHLRALAALCGLCLGVPGSAASVTAAAPSATSQHVLDQGIDIAFEASPPPHAGDPVSFAFALTDTASGSPIGGVRPAAWLVARDPARRDAPLDCKREVATYLSADLFRRADIDLNSYFVLSLNEDASISVVDPLFGFGGSKLLAMLALPARGTDWALGPQQESLFVVMPDVAKVAVADTRRWKLTGLIPTGPEPQRVLVLNHRAWVTDAGGLTVIDTDTLAPSTIPLGAVGELAASSDGAWLFTAGERGIGIVDAHSARLLAQLPLDGHADAMAYSAAARALYALDRHSGQVFVIDAQARTQSTTLTVLPGASQIRFAPDGRHALLPNPQQNVVQVLDAASNTVVQSAAISAAPDRISFTPLLAYVHRRDSETVVMIPLAQLGGTGKPLGVADFPAGQHALGDAAGVRADSIVAAPDQPAVLAANAADKMIYFYQEGMAAPAGGFSTYGATPRAVLVIDHGLREAGRGRYATTVPVKKSGDYEVVMFVDSPRVVACFGLSIAGEHDTPVKPVVQVQAVAPPAHLAVGQPARLEFALHDAQQTQPRQAGDLRALVFEAPGVWQRRGALQALANGNYTFEFVPPEAGTYYVWVESESLGLARNNSQCLVYQAN